MMSHLANPSQIRIRVLTAAVWLIVAVSGCSDFRAKQLLHTATELGARSEWSQALHYYQRLWVEFPDHELVDEAKLQAARIYAGPEKKPRSAIDLYEQLTLTAFHEDVKVTALKELSRLYASDPKTHESAIELFEIHLRRHPDHPESLDVGLQLAHMYLETSRFIQAIEIALPLAEVDNAVIKNQANLIIAQAQEYANYLTNAVWTYDTVVKAVETGTEPWLEATAGKARILEQQGRWLEALATVRELREHHPNPDAIERWLVALQERHISMKR